MDRHLGFNLEGAKRMLKDIAAFHAVSVALKLHEPDTFEMKVKKHVLSTEEFMNLPLENLMPPVFLKVVEEIEELLLHTSRVRNMVQQGVIQKIFLTFPCTEPFATIIHTELWTNNTMQKNENGNIIINKIIDFQRCKYGNPLSDVIYFLFSSVQKNIVKHYFEDLIVFYQENFFTVLENLKCDTSALQRNFLEQVNVDGPYELFHLLFTAPLICRRKDKEAVHSGRLFDATTDESSVSQEARNLIAHVLIEFAKNGWLSQL